MKQKPPVPPKKTTPSPVRPRVECVHSFVKGNANCLRCGYKRGANFEALVEKAAPLDVTVLASSKYPSPTGDGLLPPRVFERTTQQPLTPLYSFDDTWQARLEKMASATKQTPEAFLEGLLRRAWTGMPLRDRG